MPAATNKPDLIDITLKEYGKLDQLLSPLDEDTATWAHPNDNLSIRDIIAHRGHWLGLYLSWYEDGLSGLDVRTPAPGYKWNQLKSYNAIVYATARHFSWKDIHNAFHHHHDALMTHLAAFDDDRLYTKHLHPWMNDWPLGRWAEANGASHYRSATKYVRKLLKLVSGQQYTNN